jgi:hypothetical protein
MLLGAAIYHAVDLGNQAKALDDIIEAALPAMGGQRFGGYRYVIAGDEQPSKWKALSDSNLDQLKVDLAAGILSSIYFDVSKKAREEETRSLELWVDSRSFGERVDRFPFIVRLLAPAATNVAAYFVPAVARIWERLSSPYAFIHVAPTHSDLYAELTAIPMRMLGEPPAEGPSRSDWLGFWQRHRDMMGVRIRTAYWGNFLGPKLAAELIESSGAPNCPASIMRHYETGGLYLQSCRDATMDHECQRRRESLAQYLYPISLAAEFPEEAPGVII